MRDTITWRIGGEAGFGIIASGTMLARTFSRAGYYIFATNDYPSLIRGGHNFVTVRIAAHPFAAMNTDLHLLIALNVETAEKHKDAIGEGGVIVFDPNDRSWEPKDFSKPVTRIPIPLKEMVHSLGADPVMRNTVALGATVALLGAPFALFSAVIRDQFKKKGPEVIDQNTKIAQSGFDYVKKNFAGETSFFLSQEAAKEKQLILNGSEAVGIGAVRAGLKFASIYPMTPINALITFLADHEKSLGVVSVQPEDEIAGINMAIGASVAGVRSMVATSGGGFALMVEGLSFAGMIEAPLVIDLGMRVGPATGMPTYTEQGELQFVIHAGHGEFPRIVLAPSDAVEAYQLTIDAFNLADRYQVPVFLLTDKYLNESQWCVSGSQFMGEVAIDRGKLADRPQPDENGEFHRYRTDVDDGVSARTATGTAGGLYYANSYEHDETGHVTEEAGKRKAMVEKRLQKLRAIKNDMKAPAIYGEPDSEITFVSWGSTKGAVLEAIGLLRAKGQKARAVHYSWLYPFPTEETLQLLSPVTRLVAVEQNATGQLASLIREHTGILVKEKLLKYDGRPFYPEEIVEKVIRL